MASPVHHIRYKNVDHLMLSFQQHSSLFILRQHHLARLMTGQDGMYILKA